MFNTIWEGAKRAAPTAGIAVAAIALYEGVGYVSRTAANWGVVDDDKTPKKRRKNNKSKTKTKTKKT